MQEPPIRLPCPQDLRWIGELYDRHAAGLYGYALRLTGRADAAEEVVAETFLRACRGRAGFRGEAGPLTWLIRIASRVVLDTVARAGPKDAPRPAEADDPPPAPLETAEREALVAAALARLPHAQREVVVLKQFVGLRFREIADALDCPLGTVLGRMRRALQRLADDPTLKEWMSP